MFVGPGGSSEAVSRLAWDPSSSEGRGHRFESRRARHPYLEVILQVLLNKRTEQKRELSTICRRGGIKRKFGNVDRPLWTSSGHSGPRGRTSQSGSRFMLAMSALTMIGENLDDAACGDVAEAASLDHQFQLGFESRKAANPLLNFGKSRPGDAVGRCAWLVRIVLQREQGADRVNFESELARVTNENEPGHFGLAHSGAVCLRCAGGAGIRATDS